MSTSLRRCAAPSRPAALRGAACAAVLGLLLGIAAAEEPLQPCRDAAQMHQWLEVLNLQRAAGSACAAGAGRLDWEPRLAESARTQATDLALRETLSHEDGAGRELRERVQRGGYRARVAAENLAAGFRDFDDVLVAWQHSPGHCANLMRADVTEVGLACVRRPGARMEWYWVALFAAPRR